MDQQLEAEIITRVLNGDRQAYALLVDEYKNKIYILAFRMTNNREDADDLTQEIFIRAYKNLWRFNLKKKFFTWLYTISINLIRNHLKKAKIDKLLNQTNNIKYSAEENKSAEAVLIASYEADSINSALAVLEYEARAMIIMKYQQELSLEEIAEITGKSISAVKMTIYRGLDKLKDIIKK
jgi:RNA polymerase sigma-70 factor, ECF subfamily